MMSGAVGAEPPAGGDGVEAGGQSLRVPVSAAQLELIDRFQRENGLPSREQAALLLIESALGAAIGIEPRFDGLVPDREPPALGEEEIRRARELADRLRAEGHHAAAERVQHATVGARIGEALLETVREACQTVLTTIEALDPKTALLAEELRLEVDKRLSR